MGILFHACLLTVGIDIKVAREVQEQGCMMKQADEQLDNPTRGYMGWIMQVGGRFCACLVRHSVRQRRTVGSGQQQDVCARQVQVERGVEAGVSSGSAAVRWSLVTVQASSV